MNNIIDNNSYFLNCASTPVKKDDLFELDLHTEIQEEELTFDQELPEFTTEHTIALEEIVRQQSSLLDLGGESSSNQSLERNFQCNVCNKAFPYANLLKRHYRMHIGDDFFPCDICLNTFTNADQLTEHKKLFHIEIEQPQPIITIDQPEQQVLNNDNQQENKIFQCHFCDKVYSQMSSLRTHERIHSSTNSFQCNICNKVFSTQNSFKMHERTHTGERPFICEVCNKCFAQRNHLQRHNRIHTGEKPYRCNICDRTFSQQNNLKRHNRLHTGERPFQCNVCEKTFASDTNLKMHERIHAAEKPFKCDTCEKTFLQTNHLKRHQRTHLSEF